MFAVGVDDTLDVGQGDVLGLDAHLDQQINTGHRRRTGTGGDQLDLGERLALQHQRIAHGGRHRDRGAVLVIVEDRDVHPRAQLGFDFEALRRLDVFEVDRAKGRLKGGHDFDEFVRIRLIDLDVEHVNASELLEQDRLALHHRLAGQGPDIAQAEHGGAVGDHRNEVATGGVFIGSVGIGDDLLACGGDTGGIGECEIALGGHALGGFDAQFSGARQTMIIQRGFAEILVHLRPPPWPLAAPLLLAKQAATQ